MRSQIPSLATDATDYANKSQQFDPDPPQFGNAAEVRRDRKPQRTSAKGEQAPGTSVEHPLPVILAPAARIQAP